MKIFYYSKYLSETLSELRNQGKSIGFVPTMGALHKGHLELIKTAQQQCDIVVASVFVNPKQFNNKEDLAKYPSDNEKDAALLEKTGCDFLYIPSVDDIYPSTFEPVSLDLGPLATIFEGEYRPGHFDGVIQVVSRLFDIVKPHKAYFGLKDYQQCLVVKELAKQSFQNIEIVFCPIFREKDGLAMSSRNVRLTKEGRQTATEINKQMMKIASSDFSLLPEQYEKLAIKALEEKGFEVEYFKIADPNTMLVLKAWKPEEKHIILTAAYIDGVRLIDNMIFSVGN
ncbi:MAG: pantoate--beta-alanine ligase [Bacteroidia bacterium]|nr:pantoate--beta-alanine ligase [Bacteroidia bacterium]